MIDLGQSEGGSLTRFSRFLSVAIVLALAVALLAIGCGGPAVAEEVVVTYYYLPG